MIAIFTNGVSTKIEDCPLGLLRISAWRTGTDTPISFGSGQGEVSHFAIVTVDKLPHVLDELKSLPAASTT